MDNWVFVLAAVSALASAIAALTSLAQARGTSKVAPLHLDALMQKGSAQEPRLSDGELRAIERRVRRGRYPLSEV